MNQPTPHWPEPGTFSKLALTGGWFCLACQQVCEPESGVFCPQCKTAHDGPLSAVIWERQCRHCGHRPLVENRRCKRCLGVNLEFVPASDLKEEHL